MSILKSPNPHLKRNGLDQIRDAIKFQCSVLNMDHPPEFFYLLTDALPAHDRAHHMEMTDDKLMDIAIAIRDATPSKLGPKGFYAPEAVAALFNGVLDATRRHVAGEPEHGWSARTVRPSASQEAANSVISISQLNFANENYVRPDLNGLPKGRAL